MPRNGSGTYSLPSPFPSGYANGSTIDAPTMNGVFTDIQTALTASVAANGQTPITANFDWGGYNITNISILAANAIAATNITASGNAQAEAFVVSTGGPTWTQGTGAPVATQPKGSLFSRTDGGVGSTLYLSRGGGTWAAVA